MTNRKLNIEELNRIDIEAFRKAKKIPLVVVLDNVRSQHNIRSMFHTGDAFRLEAVVLCGISATPPNAEIHKSALGAEDSVHWSYYEETLDAVDDLKAKGYAVFSVEQTKKSISLEEMPIDKKRKYALILGHEVHGVQQAVVDASDGSIEIPQYGTKHSLNVSVTAGIVIHHFFTAFH